MTPANIVGMAMIKGLDVIAVTDHNSCKNCPAVMSVAKEYGILVIPGMELCTIEDIHVLCLFNSLEAAMDFDGFVSVVLPGACVYIPMDDLVDKEAEKERLYKEKEMLERELRRVNGKLDNANFVSKAPKDVVSQEIEKKQKYQDMYNKVLERLSRI